MQLKDNRVTGKMDTVEAKVSILLLVMKMNHH